jgi:hypothetical protein
MVRVTLKIICFKFYIVRNYSNKLDDYLSKGTGHVNKEVMKDDLLSSVSVTLNITDVKDNKLIDSNYLYALRNIIDKIA